MHPTQPCSVCRGTAFLLVPNVRVEWAISHVMTRTTNFHGNVLLCGGCGHVQLFAADARALAAAIGGNGQFVNVEG